MEQAALARIALAGSAGLTGVAGAGGPGKDTGAEPALIQARRLAEAGEHHAAERAYLRVLEEHPADLVALIELAVLATRGRHLAAARTAYGWAVLRHPRHPVAHVGLGDLLAEDGDCAAACAHYTAALAVAPGFAPAHQGLARALSALDDPAASDHWERGFRGHSQFCRPQRGAPSAIPLLLLAAARGGNVPARPWIDDRRFACTGLYADYADIAQALPPHALIVNVIGDADACGPALSSAAAICARSSAPVINSPAHVRASGRVNNARRLGRVPGVITPAMAVVPRMRLTASELARHGLQFPLLIRSPGFHTGQYFARVDRACELADAQATLRGDDVLAIQYLDACGADGLARKYRVMFIDGRCYPLHLAIAPDWKVHYFTSAMATSAAYRAEEQQFLDDMPGVLGPRAMTALARIAATLELDYAGIDFALAPKGEILLFEANATMAVIPPGPEPMWNYRRRAVGSVIDAAIDMLHSRASAPNYARSMPGKSSPWPSAHSFAAPYPASA